MIGVFFFVKFSNQTNVADVCCVDYSAIFTNNLSSIRNNCYFYFFRMEKKECCICNNLTGSCILSGFKKSLAKCDGVLLVIERISTTFECVRVFASVIVFYAYTSRNFSAPGLCTVIRKIRWIKLWFDSKMKISTNKRWKKKIQNKPSDTNVFPRTQIHGSVLQCESCWKNETVKLNVRCSINWSLHIQ